MLHLHSVVMRLVQGNVRGNDLRIRNNQAKNNERPGAHVRWGGSTSLGLIHTGRAMQRTRKLERFSFDVACEQCEHSH